ncbi:MAG: class I SAM-dependent methyltransferase [Candidatus Magasanikbacteria bacterium]
MNNKQAQAIIHKTRDDYNRIAAHFSDTRYDNWTEIKWAMDYAKPGQNILDWGCGNGRLINLLRDKKIKYFGLDQSSKLLKHGKNRFSKEIKAGWVKFFLTDKRNKKFPVGFFDLVFMVASFHHLPDAKTRLELLKKVYSEMKIGGRLIVTVWNLGSDFAKQKESKGWREVRDSDFIIPWKNPQGKVEAERYYHHFFKDELGGLLIKIGFKIERLDYFDRTTWTDQKSGRNLVAVAVKL